MGHRWLRTVWDYFVIALGCGLYGVTFNWFFRTSGFAMGGFTGIGQIVNRLVPVIPVGTVVFALNLPLILLAARKQGLRTLFATVFAIAANSVLIDAVGTWFTFTPMEELPAFTCGGVLIGFSLGLLLRKNATTGGTELVARLLKYKYRHLSMGRLCLIIDVAIIALYTLVFRELDKAIYGVMAMFIATKVMDLVIYGTVNARLAVIISDRSQTITQRLMELDLGATVLQGKGAWTGSSKNVILCVFKGARIAAIKEAITNVDPNVFFIVCDAREVLGEGFGTYSDEAL